MMSWRYSVAPSVSGGTRGGQNFLRDREGAKTPLELLNRSENRWGVVGTCIANDTMLRRPDQLLLTPENHHFEGSMHLKTKEVLCRDFVGGSVKKTHPPPGPTRPHEELMQ